MSPDSSFTDLLEFIVDERAVDLRGYKPTSLQRRLHKRMTQVKAASYGQYQQVLRRDPAEITQLLNTILINVTDFFRDPAAWDFLRSDVLPETLDDFQPGDTVRAWSVGCAGGQEAY